MPTIRDFLECVVPHMQEMPPEFVGEDGMEYGGLGGTAHLVRVDGVAFAVTATHVVAPGRTGHAPPDPRGFVQKVRLRQHAESRTFLDIDHASWVNRGGDVDMDVTVFAFNELAIDRSELAAAIHDLHGGRLANLCEGDHLVTRGFMRDAGSIDGDAFKIRTGALGTNGIYAGVDRDAGKHVHILRFAQPFASDGIVQGLSGSLLPSA